ncbi:ABC transporter ATP-binding protein [Inconstantimicrobium porci]|uniref:ABC transporter ATP-binding protein n=2 Tax=Inconstantimicrobium porci TaxID=2652291 RepID=A0A7X2MWT9_9CLOT|nr:ABC transporter ATP-binding protein [Inconstantimicrobium porci]MSR90547.1 ABC transporter ATP-binding protein [Inconstantimicrobium porci]
MKNKNTFKRIFEYLKESKRNLIAAFICAVISVILSLIGPILIGHAIDMMITKGNVNFKSIIMILIELVVVYSFGFLFTWILTYLTNTISYNTVRSMRKDLFDKINSLPLYFFDTNAHGDIISRFINDTDAISDGLLQGITTMMTGIATIIGAIAFMVSINWIMALIVILSAPLTYFMARYITINCQKYFKAQATELGRLNGYVEEIVSGQKTVKAFSYEKKSFDNFKEVNNSLYNVGVKSQFFGALVNPSTRLINNVVYAVVGMIGSVISILGMITIGDISSFLIYSNLFSKPFNEITGVFTQIQSAAASAQRVFDILDMESEEDESQKASINKCVGNVKFEDVEFSYDKSKKLITNLSFEAESGHKIAIVGKTGAGKTTIVNLLMRFYDIDNGHIYLDGVDTKKITRDSLRSNFAMVLQETFLFGDTIANNIAYGSRDAAREEIIAAAKMADADSFIRKLPNGYDTVISDSGSNLSQGQKQLLTIARAMLQNPPIVILDEATSNIDTRTELKIQAAFEKVMEGRTSFIIAHRLSTIEGADMILVMDHGNIVEKGTHKELLKQDGVYASIYKSQFA